MQGYKSIGFIGAGNMAEALLNGLISAKAFPRESIIASDRNSQRLKTIADSYKIRTSEKNSEVASVSDIVIIAVKPGDVATVITDVKEEIQDKLIISIAAGISTKKISDILACSVRIVRAMPNTPALVQAGATALFIGENCRKSDEKTALMIFNAVGRTVIVNDESLMDAVTGLSGSGPAYIFIVLEALADAGVSVGIPRESASLLANQTVLGAAKMIIELGKHPGELKDMVTSPGGTTIAGIKKLEEGGIRASIMSAVEAATLRSRELAKK